MADDGMSGRTTEADGCGICKRQIGLEISSEMASVAAREETTVATGQRLHSPIGGNTSLLPGGRRWIFYTRGILIPYLAFMESSTELTVI